MKKSKWKRVVAIVCAISMVLPAAGVNARAEELPEQENIAWEEAEAPLSEEEVTSDIQTDDPEETVANEEEPGMDKQEEDFIVTAEGPDTIEEEEAETASDPQENEFAIEAEENAFVEGASAEDDPAYTFYMSGSEEVFSLTPKESGVYQFADDLSEGHCMVDYKLYSEGNELAASFVYDDMISGRYASFMMEAGKNYTLSLASYNGAVYLNKLEGDPFTIENNILTAVDLDDVDYLILPEGVTEISTSGYRDIMGKNHINGSILFPSTITKINKSYLSENMGTWSCLKNYYVAEGNENYKSIGGILYSGDGENLLRVPGSMRGTIVVQGNPKTIGEDAFLYSVATEVILPDSVEEIGSSAFSLARNMKSITLGSKVKTIGSYAFSNSGLTSIELPDSVVSIGYYAFRCSHDGWSDGTPLKSVKMSKSLESIGHNAFDGAALTEIELPESLKDLGSEAFKDNLLEEVVIPESVENAGSGVFDGCKKLKKITVNTNGDITSMFEGADNLEEIVFGENVTEYALVDEKLVVELGYKDTYSTHDASGYHEITVVGNYLFFILGEYETEVFSMDGCVAVAPSIYSHLKGVKKLSVGRTTLGFKEYDNGINLPELEQITVAEGNPNYYAEDGVLYEVSSNGWWENYGLVCYPSCKAGASFTVPDRINYIADHAFTNYGSNPRKLTSVTIPKDTNLGDYVFSTWDDEIIEPVLTINGYPDSSAYEYYLNSKDSEHLTWNSIGPKSVIVYFDPNKGSVTATEKEVEIDGLYGTMPTPARKYYLFTGWYTEQTGGSKVTANTVCQTEYGHTLYAHWKKCEITKADITVKNATWTGKKLQPAVTVKFSGKTLKKGTDYKLTYSNNIEPGKKAKVVITGIGEYANSSDTVTKYFTINKAAQNTGLAEKITKKADALGKSFTLKPVLKENAEITYTVKNTKIVKVSGLNKFTTLKPGKTTITVKVAATKHYKAQTFEITLIQQGALKISLASSKLTYNKTKKEYSMKGTYAPVSLGITIKEKNRNGDYKDKVNVTYTSTLQNITGGGGTISVDMISVPFKGQVKVTVKTKKTSVYPEKTESFIINVSSFAEGQIDTDKNWKVAQNADGTFTILKYVGSATEIAVPETILVGLQRKKVTAIGESAFVGTTVKKVELASSAVKSIGAKAFQKVTTLTGVSLPADLTTLGTQTFEGCKKLKEVYLSDKLTAVPAKAFKGCAALAKITIPASAKTIGTYAFSGCTKLAEIHIAAATKKIEANAFNGCTAITDVYYGGSKAAFTEMAKKNAGNEALLSATIHSYADGAAVPDVDSISDYELFGTYADYLYNKDFFHMTGDLYDRMHEVMATISPIDEVRAAFKNNAQKGIVYCIKAIVDDTANMGWLDDSINKRIALELILAMEDAKDYQEKYDEEYEKYIKEVGAYDFEALYNIASEFKDVPDEIFADGDTRYQMARKLAAFFNDSGHSRGDATEWNKALKVIGAEWEVISKCMGYVDDASELAENVVDFIFLIITLQDVSKTTVDMLLHEVGEETNLYDGLVQIKGTMDLPLTEFVIEYIKEDVLNEISKSLVKLGTKLLDYVMKNKGYGAGTMVSIGTAFWKAAGEIIGAGVNLDAMNNGWITLSNTSQLMSIVSSKIGSIKSDHYNGISPSQETISSFEVVMNAYLGSLIQTEKYVASNIENPNERMKLDALLARYEKSLTYRYYLNSCKQNVIGA